MTETSIAATGTHNALARTQWASVSAPIEDPTDVATIAWATCREHADPGGGVGSATIAQPARREAQRHDQGGNGQPGDQHDPGDASRVEGRQESPGDVAVQ